jgi:hypothetical protein
VDGAISLNSNQKFEIEPGTGDPRHVFATSAANIPDIENPIPINPKTPAWILGNEGQKQSIQQEPISSWDESSCDSCDSSEDFVSSSEEDEPLVEGRPRNST